MRSYIAEFESKEKPDNYEGKLLEEVKRANAEFGPFSIINEGLGKGFPFSVKDNICVLGVESTASSKILKTYVPPFNATVVDKAIKNGLAFIGKTKMDEFGFGTFGVNCAEPPKNPFDKTRVAGGSSAGAAVATALLKYHVAIAESTGGSISAPAAFCGVVGFTPTYGVISRNGLIDYANSLDKIGFMARSSMDIRKLLNFCSGRDKNDTTSSGERLTDNPKAKFVIVNQLMQNISDVVRKSFEHFIDKLKSMDYAVEYIDIPEVNLAIPAYYIISTAEASTNMARYTGFKYGFKVNDLSKKYNDFFTEARAQFGLEAKRRILLGTFVRGESVKSRYYIKALKVRRVLINKFKKALSGSFVISPTMPIQAPTFEEASSLSPVETYSMDILTIPPNVCGFPHASFPIDYVNNLPVGAQIVSDHFNDYAVTSFLETWERNFDYNFKHNLGAI